MIQNDVNTLESAVEYCNTVNSRFIVIKFNAACLNYTWSILEYIYVVLLVHYVANIKYDTE